MSENKGMREPFKTPVDQAVHSFDQYSQVIDVRSPCEYLLDHIPGAINLPVLSDEQRELVGQAHKTHDAFTGSRLGAPMVAANIAHWLETQLADKPRDWSPLVYCWRGGQRSQAMATILARVGWRVHVLEGGYQAFRRHVHHYLEQALPTLRFVVLSGRTGSAKSLVLNRLEQLGCQVLDLEALANHKGSVLGLVPGSTQPTQKQFETQLWKTISQFDPAKPVFVESESKKVGKVHIPDALMANIRESEAITLNASVDWRANFLLQDYDYFTRDTANLFTQLDCLIGLHGHELIGQWKAMANTGRWHEFVSSLLTQHYDCAYDRAIHKNFKRVSELALVELTEADVPSACDAAAKTIHLHYATALG